MQPVITKTAKKPVPLVQVTDKNLQDLAKSHEVEAWVKASGFAAKPGEFLLLPDGKEGLKGVFVALDEKKPHFSIANLQSRLPEGVYSLPEGLKEPEKALLFWYMAAYVFGRYNNRSPKAAQLLVPSEDILKQVETEARAVWLGRDCINTPANDFGTEELAATVQGLGKTYKAKVSVISGDDLLKKNFPLIHAVGRASPRPPKLIDLTWGKATDPKITLVGKGVVFDTGGLDIKPSPAMLLMKKDMGGAAATISLAQMIMAAKLPVRLRLLVPAAENAISGNAFRPGDVLPSRKGLSVEIGNTDAEGRLILADALALGDEEEPELMISMATLTGAARVALGPDLPPLYATDNEVAKALHEVGDEVDDPMWLMPLYQPYMETLNSKIADISHISDGPFAGSITAALFLSRFAEKARAYVHLDIYGWSPKPRPGIPVGGEVNASRAIFNYLKKRYRAE